MSLLVCSKVIGQRSSFSQVLRDWRILALEDNGGSLTFLDLFKGIEEHRFDQEESFTMPSEFVGSPLMCELGPVKESDFQSVPLHVKVGEAVPVFGKYVKFTMKLQEAEVHSI